MNSCQYILDLLLILLSTKLLGLLSQRFYLPGVVGLVQPSDFLTCTASIGLTVTRQSLDAALWLFVLVLTAVAVLAKLVGCGLGARLCRYSRRQSLQIGVGMVSRGEVALIIASKGIALGMLGTRLFSAVVLAVVATTILTPILLKLTFSLPKTSSQPLESSCH